MNIGFQVVSYSDKAETIKFIQNAILMEPESISRALDIPGFTFYSLDVDNLTFPSAYFVELIVSSSSAFYINISGGALEVPYEKVNGVVTYRSLNVSDHYYPATPIADDVNQIITTLLKDKYLIGYVFITVGVDANGDLVYYNDFDPLLVLTLTADGDLQISGPNEGRYSVNSQGDLIYTQ